MIVSCVESEPGHAPPDLASAMDDYRARLHDMVGYKEHTARLVTHANGRKAFLIEYGGTYQDLGFEKPYPARFKTYGFLRTGKLQLVTGIVPADSSFKHVDDLLNLFRLT